LTPRHSAKAFAPFLLAALGVVVIVASPSTAAAASDRVIIRVSTTSSYPVYTCVPWGFTARITDANGRLLTARLTIAIVIREKGKAPYTGKPLALNVANGVYTLRPFRHTGFGNGVLSYALVAHTAVGTGHATVNVTLQNSVLSYRGNGSTALPPIDVPCGSTFAWTNTGPFFSAISSAGLAVQSTANTGASFIAPGRHTIQINADGDWTVEIITP
jgi:hypothetical protein